MSYPDHIYRDIPEPRLDPPLDLSEPEDDGEVEYMERLERAAPALLAALSKWLDHAEGNRSAYFRPVKGGGEAWVPLVQETRAAIEMATRGDR